MLTYIEGHARALRVLDAIGAHSRALCRGTWALLAIVLAYLALGAPGAAANPYSHGQELSIKAGGYPSTVRGYADGAAETFARLYWNGVWHEWRSCRRSNYSVHLWICEGFGVTPGRSAYAQVLYRNSNGDTYGYSPWVYSSCCSNNAATSGVIG